MAKEFLRAGCNVTLSGRGEAMAEAAHATLTPSLGKYIYVPCNVQEKSSLQNLWETSLTQWGGIDIWINNAGQNTPNREIIVLEKRKPTK
jgi:NADP-dependent 3-hydroxy acid dehydrogenase YdfG